MYWVAASIAYGCSPDREGCSLNHIGLQPRWVGLQPRSHRDASVLLREDRRHELARHDVQHLGYMHRRCGLGLGLGLGLKVRDLDLAVEQQRGARTDAQRT